MATTTQYLPSEMAAAIDAIPVFSNISSEDNGMVVVNGHLQDQTSRTIVANGTYDTTTNDEVQVNVSPSGNVTLADKVVTDNGTYLPSGDSVDGYSKVTVNVPTVSEADNGKAVSGGRLVEQTTKSISANGTYNTTLNNSVMVNVPNSGSGSSVVTYDVPDFIENTDKSKVLLDLYADDYDETNQSWGDMVLMTSTDSFFKDYRGVLKLDSQGLEVGGRYAYRFDLQNTSKVTIYAIAKRRQFISHSGEALVNADYFVADIASSHTSSYPLYAAALSYNGPFVESPIGKFNVYTLTVDIENLSASLYANGAFISSKQLDSTDRLRHIRFGEDADVQYLYVGAVAGIEDTQTIFANHHVAMTFIQDARMILPDDDMPSPMFLSNSEPDDILVNADYRDFSSSDNTFGPFTSHGGVLTDDCEGVLVSGGVALTYALPTSVNGLTVYAVIKKVFDWDKVSGAYTEANSILFQIGNTSGDSDGVYLHGRTGRTGTYPETSYQVFDLSPVEEFGVYAVSVNYRTRKANFYFEGSLKATVDISDIPYDVFTIGGRYVSGELSAESQVQLLFAGVVSGVEDSTVIAQNSIELREFMNDSRIALGTEVKSIVSKTITENGTYLPVNDNAYAYSQVTVNVPTSTTHDGYVPEFLEYSNANNILMNIDYTDFNSETGEWGDVVVDVGELYQDAFGIVNDADTGTHVTIPAGVDNATLYFICRQRRDNWNGYVICEVGKYYDAAAGGTMEVGLCFKWDKESVHVGILKSALEGAYSETYDVGIPPVLFNAYAIKLDYINKTVSFYCNDKYIGTVTATDVYRNIYFGGEYSPTSSLPKLGFTELHFLHMGIVSGDEQPDTIANNLGSMVSFINDSRIFLPESEVLVPTFLQHSQQSSILLNANYADFSGRWGGFSTDAGRMSYDCFGVRVDEDTILSCDVSQTTTGITIYMIAKPYFYNKYRYYPDEENHPYTFVSGPVGLVSAKNTTNDTTPFRLVLSSSARILSDDGKTYGAYDRTNPVFSFCAYAITAAYDTGLVTLYMNDSEPVTLELSEAISVDSIVIGGEYTFWSTSTESYQEGEHSDSQFLHFGIVNGVENSGIIEQNLADMVSFLQNARFEVPPEVSPEVSLVSKTITANGTYNPEDDNAGGYSRVTVSVPASSGTSFNIPNFIASSDKSKVLLDLYPDDFDDLARNWGSLSDSTIRGNNDTPYYYYGRTTKSAYGLEVSNDMCLSGQVDVTSATFYCVFSVRANRGINNVFYLELLETKDILFPGSHYESECIGLTNNFQSVYAYPSSDSSLLYSDRPFSVNEGDYNVFTISVDVPNKQAKYYCNGALVYTVSFTPRSDSVSSIPVKISNAGACYLYLGAVDGVEDQQTILANHSAIMSFLGSARVRHQTIPFQSSYFSRNSYYSFVRACAATDNIGGSGWNALNTNTGGSLSFDCTGVRIDENTALTCDVSVKSSSTPSESVAYSSGFTVYAICKQVKLSKDDTYAVMLQVANTTDDSSNISLGSFDTNSGPSYDYTSHLDDIYYTDTTSIFFGSSVDSTTHVDSFYNATKMGYSIYAISVSYGNTANWKQSKACLYVDGYKQAELELNGATYDKVVFGGSYNSSTLDTSHDFRFLYIAIVSCPESDGLIYRNCCDMRSYLKDACISLPLS